MTIAVDMERKATKTNKQNHKVGTFSNSADPDNVAFCQGLYCLLRQNQPSEKEIYKKKFKS